MSVLTGKAHAMAAQENCDGEEYDMIQELADRIVMMDDILRDVLYGEKLDNHGNRDDNGLLRYPNLDEVIIKLQSIPLEED